MDCDPQLWIFLHYCQKTHTVITLLGSAHAWGTSLFSLCLFSPPFSQVERWAFYSSPPFPGLHSHTCSTLSQEKGVVVAVHHGGKLVVNKIPVFVLASCITLSNCSSLCVLISSLPEVHCSLPGAFTCVPLRSLKINAGHFLFLLWVSKPLGKQGLTCLSPFRSPGNLLHLPWIPASPAIPPTPQTQKLIRSKSQVLLTLVNLNSSLAINYLSADPPWAQQLRLFPAQLFSCQLSIQSIP